MSLFAVAKEQGFPASGIFRRGLRLLAILISAALLVVSCHLLPTCRERDNTREITYTNEFMASAPWSIHIVKVPRHNPEFELLSIHAQGAAVGIATISEHITAVKPEWGIPVVAVNGDFFRTNGDYPGDPRGTQIVDQEVFSAPSGEVTFWLDRSGQPHVTNVTSQFTVTWPNGETTHFGLNEDRRTNAVLYTSAGGPFTWGKAGRELVLEQNGDSPWLPLRIDQTYTARVREVREMGDSKVTPDVMVLSLTPSQSWYLPTVNVGDVIQLSTATTPRMEGAKMAIGGGPVLLRDGQRYHFIVPTWKGPLTYRYRAMWQRHPRTALGWNKDFYYFVIVDGRQRNLSVGMTLEELADYMQKLGCTDAVNLDGGGSSTLWYEGEVRNSPSDYSTSGFTGQEFKDLPSFAAKLKKPASPLTQYLVDQFSDWTKQTLASYDGSRWDQERLQDALAREFNYIIQDQPLYSKRFFTGVPLSSETLRLLTQHPKGATLVRLNRLLLDDAFPDDIARSLVGHERGVANGLIVVKKTTANHQSSQ